MDLLETFSGLWSPSVSYPLWQLFRLEHHPMRQKLTLPLSKEGVLVLNCSNILSLHHPPYTLLMFGHCDYFPLPTNHCATLMLQLTLLHYCQLYIYTATPSQLLLLLLQLRSIWNTKSTVSRWCIYLLSIWLLLAFALSTRESTLLLTLLPSLLLCCQQCFALLNTWLQLVCKCHSGIWLHQLTLIHHLLNIVGPCSKVMIHEKTSTDSHLNLSSPNLCTTLGL